MEVVGIEVSRFEAIDGDNIVTTVDVDCKVFISPFNDAVWSIIWWLKRFTDSIMPDENMGSRSMMLLFHWVGRGGGGRIICM